MKGRPVGIIKKICKKVSQSRKKPAQKSFWSRAGLEPTSFCLADLKKPEAEEATLVWQLWGSQLIKLIKSVTSLVLKKEQAGNGPSRRHIQGSKIAKGLQSIKYSLLKYPHEEKFLKIVFQNFFGPVSRIAPKNVKGDLKKT